jgi:hypothetical protein
MRIVSSRRKLQIPIDDERHRASLDGFPTMRAQREGNDIDRHRVFRIAVTSAVDQVIVAAIRINTFAAREPPRLRSPILRVRTTLSAL